MGQGISLKTDTDHGFGLDIRFKQLCEKLALLGQKESITVYPYRNPQLLYFTKLPVEMQKYVTDALASYVGICESTVESGHSLLNSRQLVWNALKAHKLKPQSTLFERITDSQVIEIYNSSNIQIFRNFIFFKLCSYTLEDMYCRPWFELFHRKEEITNQIISEFQQIFSEEKNQAFSSAVPTHFLNEINSPFLNRVKMKINFIAPLYSADHMQDHLMVAESCELAGPKLTGIEKESKLKTFFKNNELEL